MIDEYIRDLKKRNFASDTVSGYRRVLFEFKEVNIDRNSIDDFQRRILKYSPRTQEGYLCMLRQYLKAYYPDLVRYISIPKVPKKLPHDVPEQAEILDVINRPDISSFEGVRDRVILELFYSSGLRRREVTNIKLSDINLDNNILRVNQGKNRKDRIVPISERCVKWLVKYITRIRPSYNPLCDYLFIGRDGYQMRAKKIYKIVRQYSDIPPHTFRHAYATHLLQNGMKETVLQRLLGHSKVTTTQIYTRVTIRDLKASYDKYHPRDKWKL